MRRKEVYNTYLEILYNIEGLEEKMIPVYAKEITRRHQHGWAIPINTYRRCRNLLFYKESLGRNSPYYVDLLKIEERNNLKTVLFDLCNTIQIRSYDI